MSWTTALSDVRMIMSDGPTDKLRYRKRVMGFQSGTNLIFKTFEFRRVTDLSTAVAPLGVYVDEAPVTVSADNLEIGEFTLAAAPTDGQSLRATYYIQWFNDNELTEFLTSASEALDFGATYANIPEDFRPAAKYYAAGNGYQKLAMFYSMNASEVYQLEDSPVDKQFAPADRFQKLSTQMFEYAIQLRNDVYSRKGQALAPRHQTISGTVQTVAPNR